MLPASFAGPTFSLMSPMPLTPPSDCDDTSIWNFAIGSNLHPEKRQGRANLCIDEVVPGKLQGWRLAFNLKSIRWLEPSMAGIEPEPNSTVHGVLLRFRPEEFQKLVQSEGDGHAYTLEEVEVEAYDGRRFPAKAFRALPHRTLPEDVPPSLRYLNIIREGARLSQLDPAYIQWLDALPHTEKPPWLCWISRTLISTVMWVGRLGCPKCGSLLLRALRWVDELPEPLHLLRVPCNVLLLAPVLLLGSLHNLFQTLRPQRDC